MCTRPRTWVKKRDDMGSGRGNTERESRPKSWGQNSQTLAPPRLGSSAVDALRGCDLGKRSFTRGSPEGAESESGLLASLPTAGQQESSSLFTDSSDFHGYRKHMRTWVLCLRGQQITQHHPGAVMDFIVFFETSNEFLGSLSSLIPISFPVWKKKKNGGWKIIHSWKI